jgi:uncharacterized protein (TIGR03435 family)
MVKIITAISALVYVVVGFSQAAGFEAASIRPSNIGTDSSSWNSRPGYLVMKNQTLQRLVGIAYGFTDDRVLVVRSGMRSDRFDLEARASCQRPRTAPNATETDG